MATTIKTTVARKSYTLKVDGKSLTATGNGMRFRGYRTAAGHWVAYRIQPTRENGWSDQPGYPTAKDAVRAAIKRSI